MQRADEAAKLRAVTNLPPTYRPRSAKAPTEHPPPVVTSPPSSPGGLLYEDSGGPLRRATAIASRDGDLLAYDSGEVVEHAGRVPASRLFDDDFTGRSPKTLVDALADRNQAFFAHEVAGWAGAAAA